MFAYPPCEATDRGLQIESLSDVFKEEFGKQVVSIKKQQHHCLSFVLTLPARLEGSLKTAARAFGLGSWGQSFVLFGL